MRKRIAFFNVYDFGEYKMRKTVRTKLIENGWEVYVITPVGKFKNFFIKEGSKIIYLKHELPHSLNPFSLLKGMIETFNILQKIRPRVVCTFSVRPIITATLPARLLNIQCIVNVITGLGEIFLNPNYKMLQTALEVYLKFVDKINSHYVFQNEENFEFFYKSNLMKKNFYRGTYKIIKGMGVDLEEYKPISKSEKTKLRERYSLDKNAIVFLFIGRLIKTKGIEEFLTAFKFLRSKYGDKVVAIIIGNVDKRYKGVINNLNYPGIIWIKFAENIVDYMNMSDVAVLPSYGEGMSLFLQESLAAGLPIITTNTFGNRDIVTDKLNGYLVNVGDVKDLLKAMESFVVNRKIISTMGFNSRKKAELEFDSNDKAEQYLEIFNKCVQ